MTCPTFKHSSGLHYLPLVRSAFGRVVGLDCERKHDCKLARAPRAALRLPQSSVRKSQS